MKSLKLLSLSILFSSVMACAQKKDVPKAVTEAFAMKFPNAKSVKWDQESKSEWEAEFKMNHVEYSANFENNGTWKETEHEVKLKDVPKNIKNALTTAYPKCNIEEAEISETTEGKVYEFAIENDEQDLEIAINAKGTIVKKETIKENDEGDDND